MNIYTIGFTKKNAEIFFNAISKHSIEILLDIRLNNKSQLAGFTKGDDLSFFLKKICKCSYSHNIEAAPTKELLDNYKKNLITWNDYEKIFYDLMSKRNTIKKLDTIFSNYYNNICLLCSEDKPDQCHRRLVAELWKDYNDSVKIIHL